MCFDGDIDPLWIENMNTVLDDNKLLHLANGETIRLQDHCSILFEVSSLSFSVNLFETSCVFVVQVGNLYYASPATVARVSVVHVDAAELKIEATWNRWLDQRSSNQHNLLQVYSARIRDFATHSRSNETYSFRFRSSATAESIRQIYHFMH